MIKAQTRKKISVLLVIGLILSIFSTNYSAFAADSAKTSLTDIEQSYAKAEISALVEKGILDGFADGTFKPGDSLTRAQLAKVLVLALNKEQDPTGAAAFKDVASSDWFAGYVGALVKSGITQGVSADKFAPNETVTREELAVFFVRAFGWEENAKAAALNGSLSDLDKVSTWAKPHVSFAYEIGFIKGAVNKDGAVTFNPSGKADRQALARLAYEFTTNKAAYEGKVKVPSDSKEPATDKPSTGSDKKEPSGGGSSSDGSGSGDNGSQNGGSTSNIISKPGTRSLGNVTGNVTISSKDVVLENTTINGDLILAEAIGSGDVTLKNVKVSGETRVLGGGPNSIHVADSVLATVIVNKADGSVRLVLEAGTTVQQIDLRSGALIQTAEGVGEIGPVEIGSNIPQNATVTLNGSFDTVRVHAGQINIQLAEGSSIGNLDIFAEAVNNAFNLASGSVISQVIVNAIVEFSGAGTISNAVVNVDDVDFSGLTTPPVIAPDASVTKVVYTPEEFALTAVGATRQIVLTGIRDVSNLDITQKATWSSSESDVAEVVNGVVKAKSDGTTTISANYGTHNVQVPVTVAVYQPQPYPAINKLEVSNGEIHVGFDQDVADLELEHFKVTATVNGDSVDLNNLEYSDGVFTFDPVDSYGSTLYVTVEHDELQSKFTGSQSGSLKLTGFGGRITDILNSPVAGLEIKFRKGLNAKEGEVVGKVTTDADGHYFIYLPAGIYTGELGGENTDYIKSYLIGVAATNVKNVNENFTAIGIPKESETRIVLTWGLNPKDLDSHLIGPGVSGGQFHTWFADKEYYVDGSKIVDLDWDDVTSYGPETTTIRQDVVGTYKFYVHNYSGESAMTASGAKIEVIRGTDWENPIVFTVPAGGSERYWIVFEFTIKEDGSIEYTPVNELTDENPAKGIYVN
ncbi:Endoglucanase precursor [compost metagenome]